VADAVAEVTPKCSARSDKDAPGLRLRNASDRNCGIDKKVALCARIFARINRITEGTVSITLAAHSTEFAPS